jgi:hypothetical protein
MYEILFSGNLPENMMQITFETNATNLFLAGTIQHRYRLKYSLEVKC